MPKAETLDISLQHSSDSDNANDESDSEFYSHTNDVPPINIQPYQHSSGFNRYIPSVKHLIPIRSLPTEANSGVSRVDQSGCFSFITYTWVFSYLWSAFRGSISHNPQWSCSIYDSSSVNMKRFEYFWTREQANTPLGKDPSLIKAFIRFTRTRVMVSSFIFAICLIFGFIGPTCLIRELIAFAEVRYVQPKLAYGLSLVFGLFMVELIRVLSMGASWAVSNRTGIRARGAILGLLFKKLLHSRGLGDKTVGDVVNIYANDGQRIFDAVTFTPMVITGPLILVGGLIYLLILIGPWSLLGLLMFVVFDCFQVFLGKSMVKYRKLSVENTEKRMSVMTEILSCIKLIKIYAWEAPFMDKIYAARDLERKYLTKAGLAQGLAIGAGPVVPIVATIATLLAYFGTGHRLKASETFSMITVYFVMVFGIRMIPYGMRYLAEAMVSLRTIQKYLLLDDADLNHNPPVNKNVAVAMHNASFSWIKGSSHDSSTEAVPLAADALLPTQSALQRINLVVPKKNLVAICGPVGSGKSSLFSAIIGEMIHQEGQMSVNGKLAYVSQDPWILNATIKENILFGQTLDSKRYYQVLFACSLNPDINVLPAGDETEIGEKGVTLSGGQKSRISLARALYSDRDLYLLDNPLSSLDQEVALHVFKYAIKGLLVGKTVFLVTSHTQFLPQCDDVIFMRGGKIVDEGTHAEMSDRCDDYRQFNQCSNDEESHMHQFLMGDTKEIVEESEMKNGQITYTASEAKLVHRVRNQSSTASRLSIDKTHLSAAESLFDIPTAVTGTIGEAEEDLGLAKLSTKLYWTYVKAAGGFCVLLILVFAFLLNVASSVFCTVWLSVWLKHFRQLNVSSLNDSAARQAENDHLSTYMNVYGLALVLVLITMLVKAYLFVKVSMRASTVLHRRLFERIMHAPMKFFEGTPSGRIINRFSKDMDELDTKLPFSTETFLQNIFMVTAYLIVIAWSFPWFLVAMAPLGLLFGVFVACFRSGIRSLKRFENNSRSPLFSHISATLNGLSSIHAYDQIHRFQERMKHLLDLNSGAIFMFQSAMRWLAVWLDILVVLVTLVISLLIVFTAVYGDVEPAYAGMAIAFAIQMSGIFQFAVRMQAELESKMTSVERVNYYVENVEQESSWISREVLRLDWPEAGRISFRDVRLKYRENLPFALKGISFDIRPKEKVGIVGRTGSGKSSIAAALFRLVEINEGLISIDGVDISKLGLHDLRRRMAAIPQDPVLFADTIRYNLDPWRQHTDLTIWEALEKARMKKTVSSMELGLGTMVTEGGKNMSVGERQLLCMARALLRSVRILVLDEAMANVDAETDAQLQQCLQEAFVDCTVLIIAHRLESVMGTDKILFVDNGKIVEFDQPRVLLNDPTSRFYQMIRVAPDAASTPDEKKNIRNAHV